ncbi:MAG: hypothetical protein JWQ28_2370, partial [Pedobacter sp.]|nr:hypothetical protein [Pedobacter sp.]
HLNDLKNCDYSYDPQYATMLTKSNLPEFQLFLKI